MPLTHHDLHYALERQLPAMRCAVTLRTAEGDLMLYDEAAEQVARVVERLLKARLRALERSRRQATSEG